jgi:hypothetical protein
MDSPVRSWTAQQMRRAPVRGRAMPELLREPPDDKPPAPKSKVERLNQA